MNILNILSEIEKVDEDIYDRLSPRRRVMKDFYNAGRKISIAALPLALSSMFTKAYGQSGTRSVNDVLNFALTLEYLEYHFYNHTVVGKDPASSVKDVTFNFPSTAALQAITTIRDHEKAHVDFLKAVLGSAARPELAYTNFDFRAGGTYNADNSYNSGGTFADVYTNYATFLKVATAFEDTGVRAGVLIHPAQGYLWSIGTINLSGPLADASADIEYKDSAQRVIALIEAMKGKLGKDYPPSNNRIIPNAWLVIAGEPPDVVAPQDVDVEVTSDANP